MTTRPGRWLGVLSALALLAVYPATHATPVHAGVPWISASYTWGPPSQVQAWGWPAGSEVHASVDWNGGGPDYTGTLTMPESGPAVFDLGATGLLQPGTVIDVTGSGMSKQLIMAPLSVWYEDSTTGRVGGHAVPGTDLTVSLGPATPPGPPVATKSVQADGSTGVWSADFGSSSPIPGQGVVAEITDADGDVTQNGGPMWPVRMSMMLGWNNVNAQAWGQFAPLTMTIDYTDDGTVDYTDTRAADAYGNVAFDLGEAGLQVQAGTRITVGVAGFSKELVVAPLRIDYADPDTNNVAGVGPYPSTVSVDLVGSGGGPVDPRSVATAPDGTWSTNFDAADLQPGQFASASITDADGDSTVFLTTARTPHLAAEIGTGWQNLMATGFGWRTPVRVQADFTADGTVDFDQTLDANAMGSAFYDLGSAGTIQVGSQFTLTAGNLVKHLTFAPLRIDYADPDSNRIAGVAPAGTQVRVDVNPPQGQQGAPLSQTVTATATGTWGATFTGTPDPLAVRQGVSATVTDADGDTSTRSGMADHPLVAAAAGNPYLRVFGWFEGTPVQVQVDFNHDGTYEFSQTVTSQMYMWTLDLGSGNLAPGSVVRVTGNDLTKQLTLVTLTMSAADSATDTARGTTDPTRSVTVDAWPLLGGPPDATLTTTAGATGNWNVDFSTVPYDIQPGQYVEAWTPDADGDRTFAGTMAADQVTPSYVLDGFEPPVSMTQVNSVRAGSGVYLTWGVLDGSGGRVTSRTAVTALLSAPVSCADPEVTTGPAITYSGKQGPQQMKNGNWNFNWKTQRSWAGTCRSVYVQFTDGSYSPAAIFSFTAK